MSEAVYSHTDRTSLGYVWVHTDNQRWRPVLSTVDTMCWMCWMSE